MLAWSIKACLKAKRVNRVFVSTDSELYADIAKRYGAEVPFLRPSGISGDHSTDLEFTYHFLQWCKKELFIPDLIAHVGPTTPLRKPKYIDDAINHLNIEKEFTSLRSVHKMSESAYKSFIINNENQLKPILEKPKSIKDTNMPRQLFDSTFIANCYIDLLKPQQILSNQILHGPKIFAYQTEIGIEIDEQSDLNYLNYLTSQDK